MPGGKFAGFLENNKQPATAHRTDNIIVEIISTSCANAFKCVKCHRAYASSRAAAPSIRCWGAELNSIMRASVARARAAALNGCWINMEVKRYQMCAAFHICVRGGQMEIELLLLIIIKWLLVPHSAAYLFISFRFVISILRDNRRRQWNLICLFYFANGRFFVLIVYSQKSSGHGRVTRRQLISLVHTIAFSGKLAHRLDLVALKSLGNGIKFSFVVVEYISGLSPMRTGIISSHQYLTR